MRDQRSPQKLLRRQPCQTKRTPSSLFVVCVTIDVHLMVLVLTAYACGCKLGHVHFKKPVEVIHFRLLELPRSQINCVIITTKKKHCASSAVVTVIHVVVMCQNVKVIYNDFQALNGDHTPVYTSRAQTPRCRIELFKPPVKATHRLPDELRMDSNLRRETARLICHRSSRFGGRFVLLRVRLCVTLMTSPVRRGGF